MSRLRSPNPTVAVWCKSSAVQNLSPATPVLESDILLVSQAQVCFVQTTAISKTLDCRYTESLPRGSTARNLPGYFLRGPAKSKFSHEFQSSDQ